MEGLEILQLHGHEAAKEWAESRRKEVDDRYDESIKNTYAEYKNKIDNELFKETNLLNDMINAAKKGEVQSVYKTLQSSIYNYDRNNPNNRVSILFGNDNNKDTILTGLVSSLSGNINTNIDTHFFNSAVNIILNYSPKGKITIKNKDGDSAIILAGKGDSKYNRIIKELIHNLIQKGANLDDTNNEHKTAYDYAKDNNNDELAHYILLRKAIILARNTNIRNNGDELMAILKELPKEYWFDTINGYTILMHLADKGNY